MISAFYSYKGGVGRTLSLVHTGIGLAATRRQKGYRVLLIDMDLEAPGLDVYIPTEKRDTLQGFAGLINAYRENERQEKWLEENLEDKRFISPVANADNLFVMPSGIKAKTPDKDRDRHSYLKVITALRDEIPQKDSPTASPALPKTGFFRDFRQLLRNRFTYVLIDSRSGLAEQSYASTLLLADTLVLCFRLNLTNIEGIQTVLGNFLLRKKTCLGAPDVSVIPVATPVPPRGGADVERWISAAADAFVGKKDQFRELIDSEGEGTRDDESLFPPVQRIYFEPALEIGENIVFNFDGSLKAGFGEQTPIISCFRQLAERISALNSDKDVVAASQMEKQYYNKKKDYKKALEYLFKRIRLEPLESEHWEDFSRGYTREEVRESTKNALANLIDEWREAVDLDDPQKRPENAKRLSWALHRWTMCFGQDQPDGGLSSAEECLGLSCGDEEIESCAHHLLGQVIDELVKNRKSAELVQEGMFEERLSIQCAIEHYSKAIKLDLKKYKKRGNALLFRARNLRELGKFRKALRDYDMRIVETAPKGDELEETHLTLLYEQGQTLEHEGLFDWAFCNYRAGLARKPLNEKILQELYIVARNLEMGKFADEISILWERRAPRSASVHTFRAMTFMFRGEYKAALEEHRMANLYSARPELGVLDAFIDLLAGDFDTVCDIMRGVLEIKKDDVYNRAIYATALVLAGKEGAREFIEPHPSEETLTCASAALACLELDVAKSALECFDLKKENIKNVTRYHILLATHRALSSVDNFKQIKAIRNLFDKRPLLPIVLRNFAEMILLRRIWEWLRRNGKITKQNAESLNEIWRIIDRAKAPKLKDLPPRKLSERIPILKVGKKSKR